MTRWLTLVILALASSALALDATLPAVARLYAQASPRGNSRWKMKVSGHVR